MKSTRNKILLKFLKWTISSIILLTAIIGISALGEGIPDTKNIYNTLLIIVLGSIFLAAIFILIEIKYIPYRKQKLKNKYKKIFDAEEISENVFHFRYEGFDVYLNLNFQLRMSQIGGYMESIEFHLIRAQVSGLTKSTWIKLNESTLNSMETYKVYVSNNLGIKLGWKRVRKQLSKLPRIKY